MQLRLYARMLQRGWWIIALTALAALIISLTASYRATPLYRTSARFIISPNPDLSTGGRDMVNTLASLDKRTIASTFAEVLDSNSIYKETSDELHLDQSALQSYKISTVVLPDANILELSVVGDDPNIVALLANNVGKKGLAYVSALYQVYTVKVLDPAVPPPDYFSPNPRRDTSIALILGAVLGAGLVILREQLRAPLATLRQRTVTDPISSAYTRSYVVRRLDELAQQHADNLAFGLIQFDGLQEAIGTLPKPVMQQVLRQITAIFRDALRGSDIVGRWTESAFVVLLPDTPGSAAMDTIERVCQTLSKPIYLDQSGESIALAPRAGMIVYQGTEPTSALIERAEAALEQARQDKSKAILFSSDMHTVSA